MAGTKPKVDRELLGRVAALTPGQQRWLRTVLQSVFTMETPRKRRAEEEPEERPRRRERRPAAPEAAEEPRRRGLEELLSGEGGSEEDFPELADELKGISDIADLLREGGRERRRFGDELMRLFEGAEGSSGEDEEEEEEERDDRLN
jgi:hypothetical protein